MQEDLACLSVLADATSDARVLAALAIVPMRSTLLTRVVG